MIWWPGRELNPRRQPFQGCALPPELPGHVRPATSQVCRTVRFEQIVAGVPANHYLQSEQLNRTLPIITTTPHSLNARARATLDRRTPCTASGFPPGRLIALSPKSKRIFLKSAPPETRPRSFSRTQSGCAPQYPTDLSRSTPFDLPSRPFRLCRDESTVYPPRILSGTLLL
jgi:hypothetical protein